MKETVPSTDKKQEASSVESGNKKVLQEAAPEGCPQKDDRRRGLEEVKRVKATRCMQQEKKNGEKSPKEKEGRFLTQVTDTAPIVEGGPPWSQ